MSINKIKYNQIKTRVVCRMSGVQPFDVIPGVQAFGILVILEDDFIMEVDFLDW